MALLLAVAVPLLTAPLRPLAVRIKRPRVALAFVWTVLCDAFVSNLDIARSVWRPRRPPRGAFVRIPLDLHDANGLAVLAIVTTIVPGTVWCELAIDRSALLLARIRRQRRGGIRGALQAAVRASADRDIRMSTAGLASAVGAAEGRTETRRAGSASEGARHVARACGSVGTTRARGEEAANGAARTGTPGMSEADAQAWPIAPLAQGGRE